MTVQIVYETHSVTEDNEAGIATGWLPGRLSAYGRECARLLGERRRNDNIAAVFSSDLARAPETAAIAFTGTRIPVYFDSRLRECNYGALNGAPVETVAAQRLGRIDEPFPGGQSYRQVVDATRSLLADLASGWDGRRIALIAHSANRWALDHLLGGQPLETVMSAPFAWRAGWEYLLPS
ncbi:MAG TPA: histidine phosphatase family protein [Micromonosporaceae bacterium]|nr:histidine phosphatase family protein [Micromonosporaceae bacterium]